VIQDLGKSPAGSGGKLQGVRDARAELRSALERAQRFLNLAALVSVILAGVGVAIAARRFAARHWDSVAILRCVGATETLIVRCSCWNCWRWRRWPVGSACMVGYLAQYGLSGVLGQLSSRTELPAPSWLPILPALATGFITLLGFGLPPLLRLREVPPLRVLRRDLGRSIRVCWRCTARQLRRRRRCWSGKRGNGGWRSTSALG
jgi:putative ABC transport system permease protein